MIFRRMDDANAKQVSRRITAESRCVEFAYSMDT
jgi:hypothetical protein